MKPEQAAANTDPVAFAEFVSRGQWHTACHLEFVADKLRLVASGGLDRLLVFAPPRHGKSELLKHYAAWYLGRFPDRTVIVASYNDDLAADFGRAVRTILNQYGKALFGIEISGESSAAHRFSVEGRDGGLYAVGVGGSITGRGADLFILDDVVKNDVEALSQVTQRRHWNWWRSTVLTRLEPGAAIVGVGTRWSVDDLLGKLADTGTFTVVRLPALAVDVDPLGRPVGEALWPARYPKSRLEEIRAEQGGFWWAAMYQGTPEPVSGNLFPRDLYRTFKETPAGYDLAGTIVEDQDCLRFAIADTALSDKKTADYTVIGLFALTPDRDLLLLERWRDRLSGPDQVNLLRRVYDEWSPMWLGIEAATPGLHTIQTLQRDIPVKELKPIGSKVARATTAATYLAQGRIWFPKKPWRDEWDTELAGFPHTKHDDQVDVLAYAAQPPTVLTAGDRSGDLERVELSVAYGSGVPMPESENDQDRGRIGKDLDAQLAAMRRAGWKSSVSRSVKVGSASAFLLFLGIALWMVVIFVEVESKEALKFYATAGQLWPILIGAAAVGWIIQSALPDD